MDIPLGNNIGNSLEVLEALNILYYSYNNLMRLCIELASYMVKLGLNISYEEAKVIWWLKLLKIRRLIINY